MSSGQRQGRWSGVPVRERPALRRDDLIAAGIELLGSPGGPSLTVRAACRAAGLTERYFYESFTDRDDYVAAVYDEVGSAAMATLAKSESMRDAVERFVAMMVDDPARGRVLLLAPEAEPVLARSGARWMPNFIELLQQNLTRITDPTSQAMVATGLIGALTALFTAYLDGRLSATREQFIDHCAELLLHAATR
ncbi:MAG: TetR/AcrR family transcriptional regulator [Mycobacterium kyogaense]|uniref:TetR/AcrR family transcriptional regulator n=1 Tax=Mycobacterium kyogaense TaxID=2212479 RepID=UPI002FFB2CAE